MLTDQTIDALNAMDIKVYGKTINGGELLNKMARSTDEGSEDVSILEETLSLAAEDMAQCGLLDLDELN